MNSCIYTTLGIPINQPTIVFIVVLVPCFEAQIVRLIVALLPIGNGNTRLASNPSLACRWKGSLLASTQQ